MKRLLTTFFAIAVWGALLPGAPPARAADLHGLPNLGAPPAADVATDARAKDAVCTRCHDENDNWPILSIYQTPHGVRGDARTPSCQSCHGDSERHVKNPEGASVRPLPEVVFGTGLKNKLASAPTVQNQVCLGCHKGTERTHWEGSSHQINGLACASCHKLHSSVDAVRNKLTQAEVCTTCHKERRADIHKISHHPIGEGNVACTDCHNPHGSTGPHLLAKATVTETCTTCHAEKRGPFLWEHQPVVEDCTNCHTPHGSNIQPLLKSRPPFLCDDCHDGPHNSQAPYGAGAGGFQFPDSGLAISGGRAPNPSSSAAGRACLNCHAMVHGSNSPAGSFLHR